MLKSECFLSRYDRIFAEIPTDAPVIVELGVKSGGSLRLWNDTFPGATVIGFDAKAPDGRLPANCTLVQGSQQERADLEKIIAQAGTIDIVIDDCSHCAGPTRLAFDTLFRRFGQAAFMSLRIGAPATGPTGPMESCRRPVTTWQAWLV